MNYKQFIESLHEISQIGYIPTARKGDTGVGQTLEQKLGLIENNLSLPDIGGEIELKAFRKDSNSMLTLFTKEPISNLGRGRDRYLLETFGYESLKPNRISDLYTTVSALGYNAQGFKLEVYNDKLMLVHKDVNLNIYWPYELLKDVFEKKLPSLVVVLADAKDSGFDESFHYNEAYYLEGFSFEGFMSAIEAGYIKVDLRMHMKASNTPRNHGTAFRVIKPQLYTLFSLRQKIL